MTHQVATPLRQALAFEYLADLTLKANEAQFLTVARLGDTAAQADRLATATERYAVAQEATVTSLNLILAALLRIAVVQELYTFTADGKLRVSTSPSS